MYIINSLTNKNFFKFVFEMQIFKCEFRVFKSFVIENLKKFQIKIKKLEKNKKILYDK